MAMITPRPTTDAARKPRALRVLPPPATHPPPARAPEAEEAAAIRAAAAELAGELRAIAARVRQRQAVSRS